MISGHVHLCLTAIKLIYYAIRRLPIAMVKQTLSISNLSSVFRGKAHVSISPAYQYGLN
jgi:hypothetical protein